MADSIYDNLLSLSRAKVLETESDGQSNDSEVTLFWDELPINQLQAAAEWTETNRSTMEDFTAAYKEFAGVWRNSKIVTKPDRDARGGVLFFTLAYGYADSLDDAEARMESALGVNADNTLQFTRYYPNIDPSQVVPLVKTTKDTSIVTDPVVKGETIEGTYASTEVKGEERDGVGQVSQLLTRLYTVLGGAATSLNYSTLLAALPSIDTIDDELLEPFNFQTGDSEKKAVIIKYLNPTDETACMTTITDADMELRIGGSADWTIVGREWGEDNGTGFGQSANGSVTLTLAFQQMGWAAWGSNNHTTPDHISYENAGRPAERRTKTWENIVADDYPSAVTDLKATADTGFQVLSVRVANGRNGSITLTQVSIAKITEVANDDANLSGKTIIAPHDFQSGTIDTLTSEYQHYKASELSAITDGVPSGYKLVKKTPTLESGSGLYTYVFEYEKPTWRAWAEGATYDHVSYENQGRPDERQTRVWENIVLTDADNAANYLKAEVITNFQVMTVRISNNRNGSTNITQIILKKVEVPAGVDGGGTLDGQNIIAPHDFQSGTVDTLRSEYRHYTATELAAITDAKPTTHELVKKTPTLEGGSGLYSLVFEYEKITFLLWGASDTTHHGLAPDIDEESPVTGIGIKRTQTWLRISKTDIFTATTGAVAILKNTANATLGTDTGKPYDGYHIAEVRTKNNGDGSVDLIRTLFKQTEEISGESADGELTDTKLIDPHGFQSGTMHIIRSVYEHFTSTELAAISETTPTDYKAVGQPTTVDNGSGAYDRTYLYERVVWKAWVGGAADITDYGNSNSDRETIRKTWFGIRYEDTSLAVATLKSGAGEGYIITEIRVSGGLNGSVTLTQTQHKQVNGIDTDSDEVINPHSIVEGTKSTTVTLYDSFTESLLPAPDKVPKANDPDSDVISNVITGPDGGGLYTRRIVEETVTWPLWDDVKADPDLTENDDPNSNDSPERLIWLAVDKAGVDAATLYLANNDNVTTDYSVRRITIRDNHNGSIYIEKNSVKILKGSSGSELEESSYRRLKPHDYRYGKADRITIVNENLELESDAYTSLSSGNDDYVLLNSENKLQRGGRWSVYRIYELATWRAWGKNEDGETDTDHDFTEILFPEGNDGNPPVEIRVRTWKSIDKDDIGTGRAYLWDNCDMGFNVDSVKPRNNGDGSVDLIQASSKVNTTVKVEWDLPSKTYWNYQYVKGYVNSATRVDEMWHYEKKYFTTEQSARTFTDTAYHGGMSKITPNAFSATKKTKGTDRKSGW